MNCFSLHCQTKLKTKHTAKTKHDSQADRMSHTSVRGYKSLQQQGGGHFCISKSDIQPARFTELNTRSHKNAFFHNPCDCLTLAHCCLLQCSMTGCMSTPLNGACALLTLLSCVLLSLFSCSDFLNRSGLSYQLTPRQM